MRDGFYKSSFYLTISNLATGALGFIFIITLSKEIGAEGMGLYGLIMPIYDLFCCFICGGMTAAISKKSAEYSSNSDFCSLKVLVNTSLVFDLIWGFFVALLVFIASPFISSGIIKDSRAVYPIMLICPSMIFVALSSILKGYFYGIKRVLIPAIIDIFEKAVRIFILTFLIFRIKTIDLRYTVTFAYFALMVGETISFTLLFYNYIKTKPFCFKKRKESKAQILFDTLKISFPLCLNGFLTTLFGSIASITIPRRLMKAGFTYAVSLSLIGKFRGMVLTIINFPIFIIIPICIMLVPDISENLSSDNMEKISSRIKQVLYLALGIGLFAFIFCYSFSDKLGFLFYKRSDLGIYIKYASFTAPFTFLSAVSYGILNGLGKQNIMLRNSLFTSGIELVLLYFLTSIPIINVFGIEITMIISSSISFIMNINEISKEVYLFHPCCKKFRY